MLWLALHLPKLPLEVHARAEAEARPLAVSTGSQLLQVNAPAHAAGVRPGMLASAALALAPQLRVQPRRPEAEAAALERLAGWALQYTAFVSPEPPAGLLLEIGGSLRLFGGLGRLLERLRRALDELGHHAATAVAPTPRAAWLLALAGEARPVSDPGQLRPRLEPLPCRVLPLEPRQLQALELLGIRTLGDCLTLPRAGLARRLGRDLLAVLDRALGLQPEPRQAWQPPPVFQDGLELPAEVERAEQLVFALNRLLQPLCGFLRGLDSGIQRYSLRLEHADHPATRLSVGLLRPSRSLEHLLELGRERLERLQLPAPVRGLRLASRDIRLLAPERPALLAEARQAAPHWSQLVERLSARLGEQAVQGLQAWPEHRPERAWRLATPGRGGGEGRRQRPLWLLAEPVRLHQRGSQPLWRGPLVLQRGPERIESGWWDGGDVRRDYYVARNPEGARLWIFQEREAPRQWYLQGVFG